MGGNNLPQRQARTHQVGTTPSLPPSSYHFPTGLPSANSKPLIVTEEVQLFHMNPEKVALKEPGEQRRRIESTRNTGETAPLCELGPPPGVTPPQPHPSRGVPGEAGSSAQTEAGMKGDPASGGGDRDVGRSSRLPALCSQARGANWGSSGTGLRQCTPNLRVSVRRTRKERGRSRATAALPGRPCPCPRRQPP